MLIPAPVLDRSDLLLCAEIATLWQAIKKSDGPWMHQLKRHCAAAAIRGSNAIDRIIISPADARACVEGATMMASSQKQQAISGYRDAVSWIHQTQGTPSFRYTESMLSLLHFTIAKYDQRKRPGRYRPGDIFVVSSHSPEPLYTGPKAELVPGLMAQLTEWLNQGDLKQPSLVRAAMAHLNLASIHPWSDGNGRMSRCLHTLVLAREEKLAPEFSSIEEWLGHEINTLAYYQALQSRGAAYDPRAGAKTWLRFVLNAHHRQAQTVRARIEYSARIWPGLQSLASERKLPERVVPGLYSAAVGELRRTTYQGDVNLTRDQAIRDIQALVSNGLVSAKGNGASRVYVIDGDAEELSNSAKRPIKPYRETGTREAKGRPAMRR